MPEAQARELDKVPEDKRQAVVDWAEEKAEGKPLTAAAIRKAAADVLEAEPEEDEGPEQEIELDDETVEVKTPTAEAHHTDWLMDASRELIAKCGSRLVTEYMDGLVAMLDERTPAVFAARLTNAATVLRQE